MKTRRQTFAALALMAACTFTDGTASAAKPGRPMMSAEPHPITFGSIKVDGLNIAFREAGNPANPKLVLLHGFPSGSHSTVT